MAFHASANSKHSNSSMWVKTTMQSIPPVPKSYVTQGELWNSRIHHVLEIEAYRPTTTHVYATITHDYGKEPPLYSHYVLILHVEEHSYSRQVTAYAANYWVAFCQNDEDGFLPGRPFTAISASHPKWRLKGDVVTWRAGKHLWWSAQLAPHITEWRVCQ